MGKALLECIHLKKDEKGDNALWVIFSIMHHQIKQAHHLHYVNRLNFFPELRIRVKIPRRFLSQPLLLVNKSPEH